MDVVSFIGYLFTAAKNWLAGLTLDLGWGAFTLWEFAIAAAVFSLVIWAVFRILE